MKDFTFANGVRDLASLAMVTGETTPDNPPARALDRGAARTEKISPDGMLSAVTATGVTPMGNAVDHRKLPGSPAGWLGAVEASFRAGGLPFLGEPCVLAPAGPGPRLQDGSTLAAARAGGVWLVQPFFPLS